MWWALWAEWAWGLNGRMGCGGAAAYGETGLGLENGLIKPWDEPVNDRTILWLRP